MELSGSSITPGEFFGAPEARKPGSITSSTVRRFSRRFCLRPAERLAFSPHCCGERLVNDHANETELIPVDPKTGEPRKQMEQPGYYPGYKTLSQKKFWDATTRRLVEERVGTTPPVRFFSAEETPIIAAISDRIIPQHDRLPQFRIPVLN